MGIGDVLTTELIRVDIAEAPVFAMCYGGFNVIEGLIWTGIAGIVALRWMLHRKSGFELWYAFLFLIFGVSDVVEAFGLTVWLLLAKGVILGLLLYARMVIRREFYVGYRF